MENNYLQKLLTDMGYVEENIFLSLTRRGEMPNQIFRYEYLDYDVIMKIGIKDENGENLGIVRVTEEYLRTVGLDPMQAMQWGYTNCEKKAESLDLEEASARKGGSKGLAGTTGLEKGTPKMYAARCGEEDGGAVVIFLKGYLMNFCRSHGIDKLIIIPSSTMDVVLIDADPEKMDMDVLLNMEREISEQQVEFEHQLDPCVMLYDTADNEVKIIARG
ncbi:MAG: hypothetical protein E7233_06455 [Lachnospiraceae bacterium]|nr:hypothetical protein [Lachnospiraceae bacterium]